MLVSAILVLWCVASARSAELLASEYKIELQGIQYCENPDTYEMTFELHQEQVSENMFWLSGKIFNPSEFGEHSTLQIAVKEHSRGKWELSPGYDITLTNACKRLRQMLGKRFDSFLKNLGAPASCPIAPGNYAPNRYEISTEGILLPPMLKDGPRLIYVTIRKDAKPVGCFIQRINMTSVKRKFINKFSAKRP